MMVIIVSRRITQDSCSYKIRHIDRALNLCLFIGLIVYMIPHTYMLSINKYVYPSPDTYNIILTVEKEYPWKQAPIDAYYRPFPIYIIQTLMLQIISGLRSHESLVIVHLISIIEILVGILILLKILHINSLFGNLFLLLYSLILANSIYLYGYMEVLIPQVFALHVLILLTITFLKATSNVASKIVLLLFSILSLVHYGVILIMVTIILTSLIIVGAGRKTKILRSLIKYDNVNAKLWFLLLLPLSLLHVFYTSIICNALDIQKFIQWYTQLIYDLLFEPSETLSPLTGSVAHGFSRPIYYINALGPASFISLTLIGVIMLFRRKIAFPPIMVSFFMIGTTFLLLGFARLYIVTGIPTYSIARYTNVYGFLLLGVFNIYTFLMLLNYYNNKHLKLLMMIMLILGFTATLLDPFTFQARPSFVEVESIKSLSTLLPIKVDIYFTTRLQRFRLCPPLFLWSSLVDIKSTYIVSAFHYIDFIELKNSMLFNSLVIKTYLHNNGNDIIIITTTQGYNG